MLAQRVHWEEAEQEYRQALGIDSKQAGLHTSLGRAYLRAGDFEKAEGEFHLELQVDAQSEPPWLGMAEAQLAKGNANGALEAVNRVWEISPSSWFSKESFQPSICQPSERGVS